ncbi:hypothetical protein EYC84_003036 [Monilinia fructicola]|uniref:DUF5672 domain-containing protein n=1 Tax=Monilinia fructicola TaxID=38448 RepID=A0A5M9JSE9_MONFR|nr:hypothetical protein EYC84_003036 [Monilinia fructicola]
MAVDVQQRRARNIGLGAILLLIIIWTVKLSYPNHTVIDIYSNRTKTLNSSGLASPLTSLFLGEKANVTLETKPLTDEFGDYFNGTIFNKVAVIIEDSYRPEVIPLVLHFGSVLGPTWPILIYTSIEETHGCGNLAPAEHILLFNSDSMLCSNAATSVDNFFAYDLIGTPVKDKGHRGGLSLRKRSSMLRVLDNWDFAAEVKKKEDDKKKVEDARKKEEEAEKKKKRRRKGRRKRRKIKRRKLEEEQKKKVDDAKKKKEDEMKKLATEGQKNYNKEKESKQNDKTGNGKEKGKNSQKRDEKRKEEEPEEEMAEDRWFQEKLRKLQNDEENFGIDQKVMMQLICPLKKLLVHSVWNPLIIHTHWDYIAYTNGRKIRWISYLIGVRSTNYVLYHIMAKSFQPLRTEAWMVIWHSMLNNDRSSAILFT